MEFSKKLKNIYPSFLILMSVLSACDTNPSRESGNISKNNLDTATLVIPDRQSPSQKILIEVNGQIYQMEIDQFGTNCNGFVLQYLLKGNKRADELIDIAIDPVGFDKFLNDQLEEVPESNLVDEQSSIVGIYNESNQLIHTGIYHPQTRLVESKLGATGPVTLKTVGDLTEFYQAQGFTDLNTKFFVTEPTSK